PAKTHFKNFWMRSDCKGRSGRVWAAEPCHRPLMAPSSGWRMSAIPPLPGISRRPTCGTNRRDEPLRTFRELAKSFTTCGGLEVGTEAGPKPLSLALRSIYLANSPTLFFGGGCRFNCSSFVIRLAFCGHSSDEERSFDYFYSHKLDPFSRHNQGGVFDLWRQ